MVAFIVFAIEVGWNPSVFVSVATIVALQLLIPGFDYQEDLELATGLPSFPPVPLVMLSARVAGQRIFLRQITGPKHSAVAFGQAIFFPWTSLQSLTFSAGNSATLLTDLLGELFVITGRTDLLCACCALGTPRIHSNCLEGSRAFERAQQMSTTIIIIVSTPLKLKSNQSMPLVNPPSLFRQFKLASKSFVSWIYFCLLCFICGECLSHS